MEEDSGDWKKSFLLKTLNLALNSKGIGNPVSFFSWADKYSCADNLPKSFEGHSVNAKASTSTNLQGISTSSPVIETPSETRAFRACDDANANFEENASQSHSQDNSAYSYTSEEEQYSPRKESAKVSEKRKRAESESHSARRSRSRNNSEQKRHKKHVRSLFSSSSSERSLSHSNSHELSLVDDYNHGDEQPLDAVEPGEILEHSFEENVDGFVPEETTEKQAATGSNNFSAESAQDVDDYQEADFSNSSTDTSLEEGVFSAGAEEFTQHEGPWFHLNGAVARLIVHPNHGEVIHYRKFLISNKLFHKSHSPQGWLISPRGELGSKSEILKGLLANCVPYKPADRTKEIQRRNAIAGDLFSFLHDSECFAKHMGWSKVSGKDEVMLQDAPDWLQEFSKKDYKPSNLDPFPAWKFVGNGESSAIFETLASKMEEDFVREGSRLGGCWGTVSKNQLDHLENTRKKAFSNSRAFLILEGLKKTLALASNADPPLPAATCKALFQRALAMSDEVSRFIEPSLKTTVSDFAKARRDVRENYIGNMKPNSLRYNIILCMLLLDYNFSI